MIDTENVGDRWYDVPKKSAGRTGSSLSITKHYSKHLEEFLVKQVHNPKILWLECTAGNNALDYQLIGVLAYLIAKHPKASFCIYSNDRDYEDTVDFCKSRELESARRALRLQIRKNRRPERTGQ